MKKLPKESLALIELSRTNVETLHNELMDLETTVAEAIANYNDCVSRLTDSIDAYNEAVNECAAEVENYISERSEKWQESEKAEEYSAWVEALQGATIEETFDEAERLDVVDTLEIPELPELGG